MIYRLWELCTGIVSIKNVISIDLIVYICITSKGCNSEVSTVSLKCTLKLRMWAYDHLISLKNSCSLSQHLSGDKDSLVPSGWCLGTRLGYSATVELLLGNGGRGI